MAEITMISAYFRVSTSHALITAKFFGRMNSNTDAQLSATKKWPAYDNFSSLQASVKYWPFD
jgi:hypothetical protein